VCQLALNDGDLEVVITYIPEEILFEVYKFKKINNLGIRCSRREEVKKNRENLSRNLMKPINKNHFSKWLFSYFLKVKEKDIDIDSSLDDLLEIELFNLLIVSLFNKDTESFDAYSVKLEAFYKIDSKQAENNISGIVDSVQVNTNSNILKKLEKKLSNLQMEIKENTDKYNTQKVKSQDKISLLNNEVIEMQRKLNIKNIEIEQLKIEKNEFETKVNKLELLKSDLELRSCNLSDTVKELKMKLNDALKKEIKVIGEFNLNLITKPNIKIEFLSIEDFIKLSVINHELWILQYALTPREKYTIESSMKEKENLNKVVEINSNSELLKNINKEYNVLMEAVK